MFEPLLRLLRSVGARLGVLVIAFGAVPVVLYGQFHEAEAGKRRLLLKTVQAEGHLIAESLRATLTAETPAPSLAEAGALLARLVPDGIKTRLLLRPASGEAGLFLVAAAPPLSPEGFAGERAELIASGIAELSPASCERAARLDHQYRHPSANEEVITSITPFATAAGCWTVITSHSTSDAVGSLLGRPYWRAREVRLAAAIYAVLALFVVLLFGDLWRALRRFERRAQAIAGGTLARSFAAGNRIPELDGVAQEFDRMVAALRASAEAFRRAAEDNAHAFKTPIATIAQALEPLRRAVPPEAQGGRRSLQLIESSIDRLDSLLAAARQMDEANATLVHPPHERVDLSKLAGTILDSFAELMRERGLTLDRRIAPNCRVWAGSDLLETVIENLLDNAIGFSPAGGTVTVSLGRHVEGFALVVEDQGPGAPPEVLGSMFERYVSHRPPDEARRGEQHFGIGLWIVRRNIESVGGRVLAANLPGRGLRVMATLRAADGKN